jgi:ribonucleoside-diphosphate reductase alpha chain
VAFLIRRTFIMSLYSQVAPLTPEAENVLKSRYYHDGETTWEEVAERVCKHMHITDQNTKDMLTHRYMIPNTPTLVNSGKEYGGLSACYVLDMQDSTEDIFKTKYEVAQIARAGGGVGIALSHLRPAGAHVRGSSHELAGGPVAFAHTISVDAMVLTQSGSLRPMALMFVMDVSHPDIRRFITAKSEEGVITNANISVMVDDVFMQAVLDDSTYDLHFDGVVYETVQARELFDLMAQHTHKNGEPGILFKDKTNNGTPYKYDNRPIYATNPCGEIPAPDNAVCNLASLNLSFFVKEWDGHVFVDTDLLRDAVIRSVSFLDKVITYNNYPTDDIKAFVDRYRPIGLGVMGVADMFLKLGVRYGSKESLDLLDTVLGIISQTANVSSLILGTELGIPEGCQNLPQPRRNITVLSIAPTGSISMIAGCLSGVEPPFSPVVYRVDGTGTYTIPHPMAGKDHFASAINDDPSKVVTVREHLDMLSVAQRHVDSGVSKTINLPHEATVEDVAEALLMAWSDPYIKGTALYRDGSRELQVLTSVKTCPECKTPLESDGGCETCPVCAYSLCAIA